MTQDEINETHRLIALELSRCIKILTEELENTKTDLAELKERVREVENGVYHALNQNL